MYHLVYMCRSQMLCRICIDHPFTAVDNKKSHTANIFKMLSYRRETALQGAL